MSIDSNRYNLTLGFLRTAYSDYIASRVLLNRNYTLQGAILASTAVEKYLKVLIFAHTGRSIRVHFDKLELIRNEIERIGYSVLLDKIDSRFFELLSKAYKVRYYDNITEPTTIGFFKNQFLGELDGAIEILERTFIITNSETNEVLLSPLKKDYKAQNPDLFENNWITTVDKNKKLFMETNCVGYGVKIFPNNLYEEISLTSASLTVPYNGKMTLIDIN